VTGCADLKLPTTFWIKRTDADELTVGCQSSGRTWRLVCRGTAWLGDVGNCSGGADDALAGARLPPMTSAAYHVGDDVDQTAIDFTSSLPTGEVRPSPARRSQTSHLYSRIHHLRARFKGWGSHQQRASHQTVHILFLANDRWLRDYDLVVAYCRSLF